MFLLKGLKLFRFFFILLCLNCLFERANPFHRQPSLFGELFSENETNFILIISPTDKTFGVYVETNKTNKTNNKKRSIYPWIGNLISKRQTNLEITKHLKTKKCNSAVVEVSTSVIKDTRLLPRLKILQKANDFIDINLDYENIVSNDCFELNRSDTQLVLFYVLALTKLKRINSLSTFSFSKENEVSNHKKLERILWKKKVVLYCPISKLSTGKYLILLCAYSNICNPPKRAELKNINYIGKQKIDEQQKRSRRSPETKLRHAEVGYCQVYPLAGVAVVTRFRIECLNLAPSPSKSHFTISDRRLRNLTDTTTVERLEFLSNAIYSKRNQEEKNKTFFKDLQLPLGDKKKGYRLLLYIIATSAETNKNKVAVVEVTVTKPRDEETGTLLQKELSYLKSLASNQNFFRVVRVIKGVISVMKHSGVDLNILDHSISILKKLNEVQLKNPDVTLIVCVLAKELSDVWTRSSLALERKLEKVFFDSVKSYSNRIEKSLLDFSSQFRAKNHLHLITSLCLQLLANAVKYVGSVQFDTAADYQLELISLRTKFLKILSEYREKSRTECSGENDCLETENVNRSESVVELEGEDGAAAVVNNGVGEGFLAVSTFYFNPFPEKNDEVESGKAPQFSKQNINTPVVGVSWLSKNGSDDFRRNASFAYDVVIPLENGSTSQADGIVLYIPVPCNQKAKEKQFIYGQLVGADEVNAICGPISFEFNVSNLVETTTYESEAYENYDLDNAEKTTQTLGFMIVRLAYKCRHRLKPCIRIHFVRTQYYNNCKDEKKNCIIGYIILSTVTLPRAVANETYSEDPYSIPLNTHLLTEVTTDKNTIEVLVEDLQADPLVDRRQGSNKFTKITVTVIRAVCYSWDIEERAWTDEYCSNPKLLVGFRLKCSCMLQIDDDEYFNPIADKVPHLFGAKLFAVPRYINLGSLDHLLKQLDQHWLIIPIVCSVWIVFILMLFLARRADKRNEMLPSYIIPADSDPACKYLYEVVVFTSAFRNAGTTANVTVVLVGANGSLSDPHVISDQSRDLLHRGAVDTFLIVSKKHLGKVKRVWLWHDNTGSSPGWYLDRVAVYDLQSDNDCNNSYFIANHWLAFDLAPYLCHVELQEASEKDLISSDMIWRINIFYQLREQNFWTAMTSRSSGSHYTYTQRTATFMVLILGMMVVSITFYGLSSDLGFGIKLGQVSVSYLALIIGLETALIMTPLTYFINYAFTYIDTPYYFDVTDSDGNQTNSSIFIPRKSPDPDTKPIKSTIKNITRIFKTLPDKALDKQDYDMKIDYDEYYLCSTEYTFTDKINENEMKSSTGLDCIASASWAEPITRQKKRVTMRKQLQLSEDRKDCLTEITRCSISEVNLDFSCQNSQISPAKNRNKITEKFIKNNQIILNPNIISSYKAIEYPQQKSRKLKDPNNKFDIYKHSSHVSNQKKNSKHYTEKEKKRASDIPREPNMILAGKQSKLMEENTFPFPSIGRKSSKKKRNFVAPFLKKVLKNYFSEKRSSLGNISDVENGLLNRTSASSAISYTEIESQPSGSDIRQKNGDSRKELKRSWMGKMPLKRRIGHVIRRSRQAIRFPKYTAQRLPYFYLWIGWAVVIVHFIVTTTFTILYGIQLGRAATFDWFLTFCSSMLQNLLIITPVKLIASALIITQWRGNKFSSDDWIGVRNDSERQKAIANWRYLQAQHGHDWFFEAQRMSDFNRSSDQDQKSILNRRTKEIEKLQWCYKLPNFRSLLRHGRLKIAVTQVKRFWIEALSWTLMSMLLSAILFLQRDVRLFRLNNFYKKFFVADLENLRTITDYWDYLDKSFLPNAFKDTVDLQNATFRLLGAIRIWQERLHTIKCPTKLRKKMEVKYCIPHESAIYTLLQYDTNKYQPLWKTKEEYSAFEETVGDFETPTTPWTYTNLEGTKASRPLFGNRLFRQYYPLGGYIVDLRYERASAETALSGLRAANWIDGQTSVIFTELSLYSTYTQHVTSVFLAIERLSSGDLNVYNEINTYKPPYVYNYIDLTVAIMQLVHFIVNILLLYDLVKQCREVKWLKRAVFAILFDVWNVLAIISILLSFLAYLYYFTFIYYSVNTINDYKLDPGRFIYFSTCARYGQYYFTSLSISTLVSYIRLLKVFRCSTVVTVMIDAIYYARSELFNVFIAVLIFNGAFASVWVLAFGYAKLEYRNLFPAMTALYSLMVGIELEEYDVIDSFFNNILFFVYMTFSIVFLINMYTVVIESGYTKMKVLQTQRSWDPVETLAVIWLYDKVLSALGISHSKFKSLKPQSVGLAATDGSELTVHSSDDELNLTGTLGKGVKKIRQTSQQTNVPHCRRRERMSVTIKHERLSRKTLELKKRSIKR